MSETSVLIGSVQGFSDQTLDVMAIPSDDLVFLASPGIESSYPGSGTDVTNIAPSSGQVGTITGNTAYSSGYFDSDGVDGDINWAAFTGVNDGFDGDGTAMVWAQADSDGEASAGRIFSKEAADASSGWSLRARGESGGTADLSFVVRMSGTNGEWRVYNGITIGTKHLFAVQWDSSDPTTAPIIWIDGVAASVSAVTAPVGTYDTDASNIIRLGNRTDSNGETWDGPFGLAAFYTRALLQAEHTAFYDATKGMHSGTIDNEAACTFAYGGTYLYHATAGLSMLSVLETALTTAGVDGASVFIGEDGYVHITSTIATGITWGTATALRDYLGFAGDLAPADSHTATGRSPLMWIPRRPESPSKGLLLGEGALSPRDVTHEAVDGTMTYRSFGDPLRFESWRWFHIDNDEYWTTDELNGELFQFSRDVLGKRYSFFLYQRNDLDDTLTTEAALTDATGPWVATDKNVAGLVKQIAAGFSNRECSFDFKLNARSTPEYTQ